MSNYSKIAQEAAERRIANLEDALTEDHDDYVGIYCGCWTCVVREVIEAVWPVLYQAAHDPEVPDPR